MRFDAAVCEVIVRIFNTFDYCAGLLIPTEVKRFQCSSDFFLMKVCEFCINISGDGRCQ